MLLLYIYGLFPFVIVKLWHVYMYIADVYIFFVQEEIKDLSLYHISAYKENCLLL